MVSCEVECEGQFESRRAARIAEDANRQAARVLALRTDAYLCGEDANGVIDVTQAEEFIELRLLLQKKAAAEIADAVDCVERGHDDSPFVCWIGTL
jgi:hypothetical protein